MIGQTFESNNCGNFTVIGKAERSAYFVVRFVDSGYEAEVQRGNLKSGCVKDPYVPSVFGVGFLGEGIYRAKVSGEKTPEYKSWIHMLRRCYNPKFHAKNPTYKDCEVCEEWQDFQSFASWFEENYVDGWHLDKDIKVKGNKIYSPDACMFVPVAVNSLLTDNANRRGEHPIGVSWHTQHKKFAANISVNNNPVYLGYYTTPEKAHEAYKKAKNKEIERQMVEYPQFAEYLEQHKHEVNEL